MILIGSRSSTSMAHMYVICQGRFNFKSLEVGTSVFRGELGSANWLHVNRITRQGKKSPPAPGSHPSGP